MQGHLAPGITLGDFQLLGGGQPVARQLAVGGEVVGAAAGGVQFGVEGSEIRGSTLSERGVLVGNLLNCKQI